MWSEKANGIWAESADNNGEDGSHMSLLAQHADVLTKLANVLDFEHDDKELCLDDALAKSSKALKHVPSSHPIFKDILGNFTSGTSMLKELKVRKDALRSFKLKPNREEIKEEEDACEEEVLRRVEASLSLFESPSDQSPNWKTEEEMEESGRVFVRVTSN